FARRTSDMEGPHGQLRARFADRLRRDHANRLAAFHQLAATEIASVALDADAAARFARQDRPYLHPIEPRLNNRKDPLLGEFFIDIHYQLAGHGVSDIFSGNAAEDTLTQLLDNFASFDQRRHEDAIRRAAIVLNDDD